MEKHIFKKQYQLWIFNGEGGYSFTGYDTLAECLSAEKYTTDWYITKRVDFYIEEINEK